MKASLREIEIEITMTATACLAIVSTPWGVMMKPSPNWSGPSNSSRRIMKPAERWQRSTAKAGTCLPRKTSIKPGWKWPQRDDEYGQSCFHAVSGNIERALTLLEIGCSGQVLPGWIRIDPEFAFIQDEPRFQALVAQEENKP